MSGRRIMILTYHFLYLIFVFASPPSVQESEVVSFCYNSRFKGFRLNTTVFKTILVSQWAECVMECIQEPCCRSVNYENELASENETSCEMLHDLVYTEDVLGKNSFYDYVYFNEPQKDYNTSCFPKDNVKEYILNVSCPNPIVIEKKGCFKDDQSPPRPLPNYILTDRDSSLDIYSGKEIDWKNWINYLPDFVCRCAQLAKSKTFKFFGIQNHGECWSGPSQDESTYQADGNSTDCVNTKWKNCSDQSKLACAGIQGNNYVYAIVH